MALKKINLSKDKSKELNRIVRNIYVQTNENLYSPDPLINGWKNAGFIEEGNVKLISNPRVATLIDGQSNLKGYDVEFEVSSTQFYDLFEFERLSGELCTIKIDGASLYVKNIVLVMATDTTFNAEGQAKIKLSGKCFVKNLRDVIDPNPWGSNLPEPWRQPLDTIPSDKVLGSGGSNGLVLGDKYL